MSAQEDYSFLGELADRLFGDDGDPDKRDKWLSDHMRQLGHRATSVWEDSSDDNDSGGSNVGYFDKGRRTREIGNAKDKKKSNWMYG